MKLSDSDVLVHPHMELGEGPVWDEREGELLWVDITGCAVYSRGGNGVVRRMPVPSRVGCVVPAESGDLLAALEDGVYRMDRETGNLTLLAGMAAELEGFRFNDGKADPKGRLVVGSMPLGDAHPPRGTLYSVRSDGTWKALRRKVGISNGMAWSAAGDRFFYIDTPERCVFSFACDPDSGLLSDEQVCVRIPEGEGGPDGMCADAEGMLWIAHWGGWRVSRYDPGTGRLLDTIHLPVERVTCCCFGGKNLDELYITTAATGLSAQEREKQPLAGAVFLARPGVRGVAPFRFRD